MPFPDAEYNTGPGALKMNGTGGEELQERPREHDGDRN